MKSISKLPFQRKILKDILNQKKKKPIKIETSQKYKQMDNEVFKTQVR